MLSSIDAPQYELLLTEISESTKITCSVLTSWTAHFRGRPNEQNAKPPKHNQMLAACYRLLKTRLHVMTILECECQPSTASYKIEAQNSRNRTVYPD